jgi:eukaryotic-like serine/threonine-protein kinase
VFAVGTLLAGKYRIDRIIGQGGMGMVVAATHIHLQQQVALKFLLPEFLNNTQVVERFVREARASAALRGEHVCRVSDVGALDMGAPYIVMELLEGVDLATLLVQQGTMQVAQACDYVLQASIGVAEAHGMSIVHRDLKPANLFLTRRPDGTPQIKVLDFGIAKAQGDSNLNLTKTTSILGSPGYMSPEQLRSSKDVDIRSDIWSLGVILYELVTGRPPFTGESITELAIRVTMDPTPPLIGRMPHGFDQVVNRCLAKDKAQRYPDLANLAHALAAYAGPNGWEMANTVSRVLNIAPRPPTHQPTPMAGVAVTQPPTGSGRAPSGVATPVPTTMGSSAGSLITSHPVGGGKRWGIIAGVGVVAAAAIVIAIVVGRSKTGGTHEPAAAAQPPPPPVVIDAAVAEPAVAPPPPADAAEVVQAPAPDAAEVAAVPPPETKPETRPKTTAKTPGGKTTKKTTKTTKDPDKGTKPPGEDFGESRF